MSNCWCRLVIVWLCCNVCGLLVCCVRLVFISFSRWVKLFSVCCVVFISILWVVLCC